MNITFQTKQTILGAGLLFVGLTFASSTYAQFTGVTWTRDGSNTPRQDKSGSGNTPSTVGATDNQDEFRFRISTTSRSSLQRQEWQFERRDGYVQMQTEFRISSDDPTFDRISLAQNHDDQTGSAGVFSIYQVRRDGNGYVFGVQGDTTEADNGYSTFETVPIQLDRFYRLKLRSFIDGRDDSFEVAELYENNVRIWREEVNGGGDVEGYYKIGPYSLTNGSGRITVDYRNTRFWTGSR